MNATSVKEEGGYADNASRTIADEKPPGKSMVGSFPRVFSLAPLSPGVAFTEPSEASFETVLILGSLTLEIVNEIHSVELDGGFP